MCSVLPCRNQPPGSHFPLAPLRDCGKVYAEKLGNPLQWQGYIQIWTAYLKVPYQRAKLLAVRLETFSLYALPCDLQRIGAANLVPAHAGSYLEHFAVRQGRLATASIGLQQFNFNLALARSTATQCPAIPRQPVIALAFRKHVKPYRLLYLPLNGQRIDLYRVYQPVRCWRYRAAIVHDCIWLAAWVD